MNTLAYSVPIWLYLHSIPARDYGNHRTGRERRAITY
jgi:hypothetical protein